MPPENQPPAASSESAPKEDFLQRVDSIFTSEQAKPSSLFQEVSRRLAQQSARGEMRWITAHEGRATAS